MAEAPEPCSASTPLTKEKLQRYFNKRSIPWACCEQSGEITLELDVITLRRKQYTLRLLIPGDFPNSIPKLAVVKPPVLRLPDGTAIPSNAPDFQTLGSFRTQEQQDTFQAISVLCPPTTSDPGVFIQCIFIKGIEWLSAFEEYLVTRISVAETIRKYGLVGAPLDSKVRSSGGPTVGQIWSEPQKKRLIREKSFLEDHFLGAENVQWSANRKTVDVTIKTEKVYVFRVYLPDDYPNSCPQLAIVNPEVLYQVNNQPLPLHSKEFRTLGRKDGALTICHFNPNEWNNDCNIASVISTKAIVWVHAYEMYLSEGDRSFLDCLSSLSQCSER